MNIKLPKPYVRFILFLVVIGIAVSIPALLQKSTTQGDANTNHKSIGITQIASHPGLDELRQGVLAGLAEKGWKETTNLTVLYRNANRDPNLTLPIAQSFVRENVDLIIALTTPSALAAAKATDRIPVVFGAVTDPVGVGLVKDLSAPAGKVTGTSDRWPIAATVKDFLQLVPGISRIGMLYSPGDNVSAIGITEMRLLAQSLGFTLVERPVSSSSDVYAVSRELFSQSDAIYTGMDNMVVENLEAVLKAGFEARKPVFSGDHGSVERGALFALGIDQSQIGKETGYIAARVLNGEPPGNIPVYVVQTGTPAVNLTTADKLGLVLDLRLLHDARVFR